jgi:hypothetical protein
MRVATGWTNAFGAGFEDFNGVTARELGRRLSDRHTNQLTRQTVAHEHDSTVVEASHGAPGCRAFKSYRTG